MKSISFIIPTYNNLELLIRSIQSIEKQMDISDELIIIDDGSTDNTLEYIAEKYIDRENFIIETQVNSGSGTARNRGIEISTKNYIWFVDSDDYIVSGAVDKIKEKIGEGNFDVILFDYFANNINKESWRKINIKPADKVSLMLTMHFPWNKVIRKKLFNDIRFPAGKIRYQDHGTIPIILSRGEKFAYIQEPLYVYDFTHPDNISKKNHKNDDMYLAFQNLLEYSKKGQFLKKDLEILFIYTFVFSQIYNTNSNNFKSVYNNTRKVKAYLNEMYPEWKKSSLLTFSFGKDYKYIDKKINLKIIIGKILKWSVVLPSLAVYIFKKIKSQKNN